MITLDDIIEHKKHKLERLQEMLSLHDIEKKALPVKNRGFKTAISRGNKVNLIAELKKASPSHGIIRHDFDPVRIASASKESGASALSILTEDKYFQGSLDNSPSKRCRKAPIMRQRIHNIGIPYIRIGISRRGCPVSLLLRHWTGVCSKRFYMRRLPWEWRQREKSMMARPGKALGAGAEIKG
jgi:hypothetical protein